MSYGSIKISWKPWRLVRFDLIFTMMVYMHQFEPLPTHKIH